MDEPIRRKTLDDWRKQAEHVIHEIHTNGYYIDRWRSVEHKKPLRECNKEELLKPFQDFWERLPDRASIRVHPFFAVCDLAEEYCFGDAEPEDYIDIRGIANG